MLYKETIQITYVTWAECGMLKLNFVVQEVATWLQTVKKHTLDKDSR